MSMIGIEFRTDGYLCDFIGEMISKYEANLVDAVLLTFNGLMAATDREAENCPQSAAYALLFKSKLNEFLAELNHSFRISDFNPYRDGLRVAISQLRQAGDAFAASIIESKANQ